MVFTRYGPNVGMSSSLIGFKLKDSNCFVRASSSSSSSLLPILSLFLSFCVEELSCGLMDSNDKYKPTSDFQENCKESLLNTTLTDSTELWLIQWPINQLSDFDGKEVTLKLHQDGRLSSFDGASGKSYEIVSYKSQEPDATVFLPSETETKAVGKISRRVCLLHYPEPSELEQKPTSNRPGRLDQRSTGTTSTYLTPSQGSRQRSRSSGAVSGISLGSMMTPTRSSMPRSSLFESGELSRRPKKRQVNGPTSSIARSYQDSEGREGRSDVSSLGSGGNSHVKKKVKNEME